MPAAYPLMPTSKQAHGDGPSPKCCRTCAPSGNSASCGSASTTDPVQQHTRTAASLAMPVCMAWHTCSSAAQRHHHLMCMLPPPPGWASAVLLCTSPHLRPRHPARGSGAAAASARRWVTWEGVGGRCLDHEEGMREMRGGERCGAAWPGLQPPLRDLPPPGSPPCGRPVLPHACPARAAACRDGRPHLVERSLSAIPRPPRPRCAAPLGAYGATACRAPSWAARCTCFKTASLPAFNGAGPGRSCRNLQVKGKGLDYLVTIGRGSSRRADRQHAS